MTNLDGPQFSLVGCWALEAYETLNSSGESIRITEKQSGTLTYTASGEVRVTIRRDKALLAELGLSPRLEELSYSGHYHVDIAKDTVHHHIQESSEPGRVGTTLLRQYHLRGDQLEITGTGLNEKVRLIWKRKKFRETVRALLIDSQQRTFLVQHRESNPAHLGKWATIGGGIDLSDRDHLSCLKREIAEEFGLSALNKMSFGKKLFENKTDSRVDYFYFVEFNGDCLAPVAHEEIMAHSWFSEEDLKTIPLFFGFEAQLFREALESLKDRSGSK